MPPPRRFTTEELDRLDLDTSTILGETPARLGSGPFVGEEPPEELEDDKPKQKLEDYDCDQKLEILTTFLKELHTNRRHFATFENRIAASFATVFLLLAGFPLKNDQ